VTKLIDFLNHLEEASIYYKLDKCNDEYIMVEVSVPGERGEIEFADNDVRIEKFRSDGNIYNEDELENLFQQFSD
jgi:hypothetical protein